MTTHTDPPPSPKPSLLQKSLWLAFFYSFGVFNFFFYLFLSVKSGAFFKKDTEQDQLRFAISRDRFWNLSKQPIPHFEHAFFKTRGGKKLHFITNRPRGSHAAGHGGNLVLFLHGFPDSIMMWRRCLEEPEIPTDHARLVCLDLPNYGGSDTFDPPDTSVLEAVSEFILAMKDQHAADASEENKDFGTIVVAHDWGCVIAFRLASEACALADRFILSNGPHVPLSLANKDRIVNSSMKIFKQFQASPRKNLGCLSKSFNALRPLVFQVFLFGYIFAFHMPKFMVKILGTGGNYAFLRGALRSAHGRHKEEWDAQESLASTLGPGVIEVESKTADGESYAGSVHARASSAGEAFWQQTAYYRNGLGTSPWTKSLELIADLYNHESESSASASVSPIRRRSSSSASSALFTEQYAGSLKAPTTIIWGEQDMAVTKVICLDGIGDYLAKGSEVIILPQTSHWAPVEPESRKVIARALKLCAGKGAKNADEMPVYMAKEVNELYAGATSMVRK